jgi:hypothetical protein
MDERTNTIKIAVIEEQIVGLREQQKVHNESTQKRFDGIARKIDDLTAIMNRGKGAYAGSMAMAAAIGAILIEAINVVSSFFNHGKQVL